MENSDPHAIIPPNLISEFEMTYWYHGISGDPPKLMWRSDFETNPFPSRPPPGSRFFNIPAKTAHGVFGTPLNAVWDDIVAPRILASLKARGLKYSSLKTVRFSFVKNVGGENHEFYSPVVVWISVHPNTTSPAAVRDATPDILRILAGARIRNVVVEWYEGHPFNAGLGIPIARQSDDAQGTLTLLFKEVKTSSGEPSERILALTNKHVASADTAADYEFDVGTGDPHHILVCGGSRFTRAVAEIEKAVETGNRDIVDFTKSIGESESKLDTPEEDAWRKDVLAQRNKDQPILQALLAQVSTDWQDADNRRLGVVDWAPKISASVDHHCYTRDIATFEVDREKLKNFKGNIIDLGNQYNHCQLGRLFWPGRRLKDIPEEKSFRVTLQLPIRRVLTPELITHPDTEVVAKYGNATKLTLGRYSGMHAYICTDSGIESREIAFYNYERTLGSFSGHGDSGSLVFTCGGDALAVVHSGMARGVCNHVTFGTPAWWVIKQVLVKYPFAEFYGMTHTLD
ncbi:hypothetical protein MD484_g192, partial [Candolleomyces efflorescens]